MVEHGELAKGLENLDAEHHDDQEGANLHIPGGNAARPDTKGHGRAGGDAENGDAAGGYIGGEDAHGAAVEGAGTVGEAVAVASTLAEGFKGGQALYAVQEVGPKGAVGLVAVHAALLVPAVEDSGNDEGEEGEAEEYQGHGPVQDGHEDEDKDRCDGGDEYLGKVLAKEGLEAFDAVAEGEDDAAGASLIEVARAEGEAVPIEVLPDLDFDDVGGVVGGTVLKILENATDADEDGDTDHGEGKGGVLGLAAEDPCDYDAEDGQPRDSCPDRDEAQDGGKENAEPDALSKLEQSNVEVHKANGQ